MKVYNTSEARQNFETVLNTALKEEVIIERKDGRKFKLIAIPENKSKTSLSDLKKPKQPNVTMDDILQAIKRGRGK